MYLDVTFLQLPNLFTNGGDKASPRQGQRRGLGPKRWCHCLGWQWQGRMKPPDEGPTYGFLGCLACWAAAPDWVFNTLSELFLAFFGTVRQ